jgi:arylsulfatase A-like enzyme
VPNNYILIVFDSCRYDSFVKAGSKTISRLGPVGQRYSYASWTSPSHFNLLTGLMPHRSPQNVIASEYYKGEFLQFRERLGTDNLEWKSLIPKLYLPCFLREKLGYRTHAFVSLPVLNPKTILNTGFDSYKLMPKHNDMRAMLREMTFSEEFPSFYLLNVGETHYPYALPDEPEDEWPRVSGVHGVFKHLDQATVGGKLPVSTAQPFSTHQMRQLQDRQTEAVRYLDKVVEELLDIVPAHTYVTITSDHGELFGEDGYFGHGPIYHPKVFEVPFVEGLAR